LFSDIKELKGVMNFCPILLTYVHLHLSIEPTLVHFNMKETADSNGQYAVPCAVWWRDGQSILNWNLMGIHNRWKTGYNSFYFSFGPTAPSGPGPTPPFTKFLDHTQRRTTISMTPLDEWSARLRDVYLTAHNIPNRHLCSPVGFELAISAGKRPQTHALDRAATGTSLTCS
jgi:hypothetical protein